jgi:Na+/melibiose symporter-like transporter
MEIAAGKAGTTPGSLRWYDQLFINANWFALTLRSQVLAGLLVPLLVQGFVGEEQKGAYFGTIRLWALMGALLFQALFGIISDHSRLRWGRRRPFILLGAMLDVAVILSMAWVAGLSGLTGYYVLFGLYLLSMAFTNLSQAATQGLIPDLVPQEKRGIASSVKTLLEIPLPLVIVGLVIAPIFQRGSMATGLIITGVIMLICMGLAMLAKEKPLESAPPLDWKPFFSLLVMTAVFTGIILGLGQAVKATIPLFPAENRLVFGAIGVIAMSIAVVAGVFASLYIHLGASARENRAFTWLVINRLAALVAITNIGVFLLYFVQEKFNLPGKEAAGLAGTLPLVLGVCVIIFGLAAGWLADRMDRRLLTVISGLIGALGVSIMVIGQTQMLMYVAAVFIGMAYAAFNVASWALGTDIVPKERSGEFLGLQNLAGAGAGAIGAYIGGAIADSSGYVLLMTMFGVMFLLSSIAALFVHSDRT